MFDVFRRANWQELSAFFEQGHPPIYVLLLFLNTIVFIIFMLRRMRGARALRADTSAMVQTILLAANMLAIFSEDIRHAIHRFL
jgi:hypothetical protein